MQARRPVLRRRVDSRTPMMAGSGPLAKVPPIVAFVAVIVVFVIGVLVRGVPGAIVLGVLDLAVLGLLAATWQVLKPADRVLRVVVVLILAGVAVSLLR